MTRRPPVITCPYCEGDIADVAIDESVCLRCGATHFVTDHYCACGRVLVDGECPACPAEVAAP